MSPRCKHALRIGPDNNNEEAKTEGWWGMGAGGSTVELAALGEAGTGREGRRVAREEASVCLPALHSRARE
ncbi:hypothetical protein O3P69_013090 [Scylla paramamosain]|uniref:Uncharacterized protein n=1 Tax=Scylla paramamosain TaxID=85552 RepID=A0AAW0SDX0_SCYPA